MGSASSEPGRVTESGSEAAECVQCGGREEVTGTSGESAASYSRHSWNCSGVELGNLLLF